MKKVNFWFFLFVVTVVSGCATQSALEQSHAYYCAGAYADAAECIKRECQPKGDATHVLDNLQMGAAHFAGQNHAPAEAAFADAESGVKEQDHQTTIGKAFRDNYVATTYDETITMLSKKIILEPYFKLDYRDSVLVWKSKLIKCPFSGRELSLVMCACPMDSRIKK